MRQRREVKICAAALNSLSTAAELGRVELIFVKAAATDGYDRRLSTVFRFDAKYISASQQQKI